MATSGAIETVAVLGAGSSGQATAGYLALSGYRVRLWNRADETEVRRWLDPIARDRTIHLRGAIEGAAKLENVTSDLGAAVSGATLIIVATTADAHRPLAGELAKVSEPSQPVMLISGGTFGAFDIWRGLIEGGLSGELVVGETSTTPLGSQVVGDGVVHISGKKRRVEIASLPGGQADRLVAMLPEIPLVASPDVLETGLGNVGPSLHVAPMVLNAGWVEAHGGSFRYYRDAITRSVAEVARRVDEERLAIAAAFGKQPISLSEYLVTGVAAPAGTLYESINGCEMYAEVLSPKQLDHRFLWEDTLAGALPMTALAEVAGVPTPTISSLVTLAGALLGEDLIAHGRTAESLGISGLNVDDVKTLVSDPAEFERWKSQLAAAPTAGVVGREGRRRR